MSTTRYSDEQVLRKRTYPTVEMGGAVSAALLRREVQDDGRIRYWRNVTLPDEPTPRILRVVALDDGATLYNALLDRGYREDDA